MTDSNYNAAIAIAIKHIGIATYSSGSIRDYIIKKGFDEAIAEAVVAELVATHYIDDRKACRKVLLLRTGKKQESRLYALCRLNKAGIGDSVAESYISQLPSDKELCLELYKAYATDSDIDEDGYVEKFCKLAKSRGFSIEVALSTIKDSIK